jgi:hypothetical protein
VDDGGGGGNDEGHQVGDVDAQQEKEELHNKKAVVKAEPRTTEEASSNKEPAVRHFLDDLLEDFTVSLVSVAKWRCIPVC